MICFLNDQKKIIIIKVSRKKKTSWGLLYLKLSPEDVTGAFGALAARIKK